MHELTQHNKLNLLHPGDRHALKEFLAAIKQHAPVMHISFSTEPTESFLAALTAWLRHEINPRVLFTIGLQPAIGAGCMVRTTNKYFDMSLRQTFVNKRQLLLEQLIPAAPPVPAAPTPLAGAPVA
jgi:F0F1-type ATP synthase delta subunit